MRLNSLCCTEPCDHRTLVPVCVMDRDITHCLIRNFLSSLLFKADTEDEGQPEAVQIVSINVS